jgi:uncharacterized protein (DUF427 family)
MQKPTDPVDPGPDQESVWDYPRPPRLERVDTQLRVVHAGHTIAETDDGWRVLETSHPPTYYFPAEDVDFDCLQRTDGRSLCEWKGQAHYYDIVVDDEVASRAAWSYPDPTDEFAELTDAVSFFVARVDEAWVGDEKARPQPGGFYGGWVTSKVVGPFKGEQGTGHW